MEIEIMSMKDVSYEGIHTMKVRSHPKPKLTQPTDAVLRAPGYTKILIKFGKELKDAA
jgi:hypothetical protein